MVLGRRRGAARGDSGISLVIVAMCMVAIVGVAAIVVDLGNARQIRRELQGGVDAAALAAARDLPLPSNNAATRLTRQKQARQTASDYATRNLVSSTSVGPDCTAQTGFTCTGTVGGVTLTITTPWNPTTGTLPANTNDSAYIGYVYVQACQSTPTFFANVIQQKSPRVCRSAVGRYQEQGGGFDFGLVATDPSKCGALTFAGDSATTLTSNGAVMVNSNCASGNAQALDSSGSSWQLKFLDGSTEVPGFIGVVGGATLAPCDPQTQTTKCTQTVPTTGISPFGDPLAGLIAPSPPAGPAKTCDKQGGRITPGLYSDCVVTSNGANLDMEPGIYYVNGDLKFTGGNIGCVDDTTTMKCTGPGAPGTDPGGILIFVKGSVTLTGNGSVYLPPYRMTCVTNYTGTCYDGLSIWQTGTSAATLNGTDNFSVGSIYVPNANLKANGSGGGAKINVTGIVVADTVEISGTFNFNISVPTTATDIPQTSDFGLEK